MNIHTVPGLMANCFLIEQGSRLFLIDAGFLGFEKKIFSKIRRIGKTPDDLSLILLTHNHIDHFGGLPAVHGRSRALVGCHTLDSAGIVNGSRDISPPINRFGRVLEFLASLSLPFFKTKGVVPDVKFDKDSSLHEFGLDGKALHAPGHTRGHIVILLDDGSAFIGDLAMGPTAINNQPSIGSFAENINDVGRSLVKILDSGASMIYPAHGNPFPAHDLEYLIRNVRDVA